MSTPGGLMAYLMAPRPQFAALPPAPPRTVDPPPVAGRVPPHDLDAEAAVLSAILLDRDALDRVLEILKPEHFYSQPNARIYQACQELAVATAPIDIVNVSTWLRDREWLVKCGGTAYLAELADATPAIGHVEAHAKTVHEKWRLRQIIATAQRVAAEGYGDVGEVQRFIDGVEQAVYDLARSSGGRDESDVVLAEGLKQYFAKITEAAERGARIVGTPTGFDRFDDKTAGLHEGDLIIVAGRPGMGKSAYVMNLATNVASPREVTVPGQSKPTMEPGLGVCVFSLEMPREQLIGRMACSEARVDLGRVRTSTLQPEDWRRLIESSAYLSTLPIWIDDTPAITLLQLRAKVRRRMAQFNREATPTQPAQRIGLVVIDYLQLMKGRDGVNSREQEISEISRGLKALAKELKVPVIALSQLNRAVETRSTKDKRPQLSDLRESGAIEQDADMIVFIYRPEYYDPSTDMKGIAELIIAKQRSGPTGKVKVRFNASYTRFDNLEPGDYPESREDDA